MSFAPDFSGADLHPSPNFGERRRATRPDMVILHYTGMQSGALAEDWLADPASEVSCHYIVHEDGRTVQMVREADRAWHAGASFWQGERDINSRSVGIEIVNAGHTFDYPDFPDRQIEAVAALCRDICRRHAIRPERVLAHSDVAPGRKIDPGEKFPWRRLHQAGVGHWAEPEGGRWDGPTLQHGDKGDAVVRLQARMKQYGFDLETSGWFDARLMIAVTAFQRHFRASLFDGRADPETTARLHALLAALA